MTYLNPEVWLPHYFFFLTTTAMTYPHKPNTVTKKKYYEFVMNLPLYCPVEAWSANFSKLLDEYPITPYLDSRDSFVRWIHFIYNKVQKYLEKDTITLDKFYLDYYEAYKPPEVKNKEFYKWRSRAIYVGVILSFMAIIYYFYNK